MTGRYGGRAPNSLRKVTLKPEISPYAEGSCLAHFGNTKVICTASVEDNVPNFLRNSGTGWVTAEYGMLPRSTHKRTSREAARGKQSGRTHEIQRLIGRSLRAVTNLSKIGERQIRLDCDVIQADGGTRCASITGAWVALHNAFTKLVSDGKLEEFPMTDTISAISCGICSGVPLLDLDYAEDLNAETDANFVLTGRGAIVEIQGTAEKAPFSRELLDKLIDLAFKGTKDLAKLQKESISTSSLKFNGNL